MNLLIALLLTVFPSIDEQIPSGAFAYPGLHPREVILLDPDHSPLLQQGYRDLKKTLSPEMGEEDILQALLIHVKNTLFDPSRCSEKGLIELMARLYPNELEPDVSIETFLQEKTGVCRHIALVTTYYLHLLICDGWLKGTTYLIRDEIPHGRHAWTLFLSSTSAWHLDAYWGHLEDGKIETGYTRLCHYYGIKTMERQARRWQSGY